MASVDDRDQDEVLYDSPKKKQKKGTPDVPYYLRNFNTIVNHVLQNTHNQTLFPAEELQLLWLFQELSELSQQLYVRLFLRQRKWMQQTKIVYPKIAFDLTPVLRDLVSNMFILDDDSLDDLPFLLDLLQLPQLKQLCKDLKIASSLKMAANKSVWVNALLKHTKQYRPLFGSALSSRDVVLKRVKALIGSCYKLAPIPDKVFKKCVLLFSLESTLVDEDDDSHEAQQLVYRLFEVDIGRTHFPDYSIIVTQPLFPSMEDFVRYFEAYERKHELLAAAGNDDLVKVIGIAEVCLNALNSNHGDVQHVTMDTKNMEEVKTCFEGIIEEQERLSVKEKMTTARPRRTVSAPERFSASPSAKEATSSHSKPKVSSPPFFSALKEESGENPPVSNIVVLSDSEEDCKSEETSSTPVKGLGSLSYRNGNKKNGTFEKKPSHKLTKRGKYPKKSNSVQSRIDFVSKKSQLARDSPQPTDQTEMLACIEQPTDQRTEPDSKPDCVVDEEGVGRMETGASASVSKSVPAKRLSSSPVEGNQPKRFLTSPVDETLRRRVLSCPVEENPSTRVTLSLEENSPKRVPSSLEENPSTRVPSSLEENPSTRVPSSLEKNSPKEGGRKRLRLSLRQKTVSPKQGPITTSGTGLPLPPPPAGSRSTLRGSDEERDNRDIGQSPSSVTNMAVQPSPRDGREQVRLRRQESSSPVVVGQLFKPSEMSKDSFAERGSQSSSALTCAEGSSGRREKRLRSNETDGHTALQTEIIKSPPSPVKAGCIEEGPSSLPAPTSGEERSRRKEVGVLGNKTDRQIATRSRTIKSSSSPKKTQHGEKDRSSSSTTRAKRLRSKMEKEEHVVNKGQNMKKNRISPGRTRDQFLTSKAQSSPSHGGELEGVIMISSSSSSSCDSDSDFDYIPSSENRRTMSPRRKATRRLIFADECPSIVDECEIDYEDLFTGMVSQKSEQSVISSTQNVVSSTRQTGAGHQTCIAPSGQLPTAVTQQTALVSSPSTDTSLQQQLTTRLQTISTPKQLLTPSRQPLTSPQQPMTFPQQPLTNPRQVLASSRQPLTSPRQPVTSPQQPLTIPRQPLPLPQQPSTTLPRPSATPQLSPHSSTLLTESSTKGKSPSHTSSCTEEPSSTSTITNVVLTTNAPDVGAFKQFSSKTMDVEVLNLVVEVLEKKRKYREACSLLFLLVGSEDLGNSKRGHWFERLALNLDFHLKRYKESMDVIVRGLADPTVHPARKHALHQRALKICKSQKMLSRLKRLPELSVHPYSENTIYARNHPRRNQGSYALFMKPNNSPSAHAHDYEMVSVEEVALTHYKETEGWPKGIHCEGSAFSTIFGLLFWDIIFFFDVPNVFRSRYQNLPLDFNSPAFYTNRKTTIDERLQWIKSATRESLGSKVEHNWNRYNGEQCGMVSWSLVPLVEDIKSLTTCLGPDLLWRVCELYSRQRYSHYRSGLPDLLLWKPETFECKFVEVKGPHDRLSSKQVLWLGRLSQWNQEAHVCWVKVK